MVLARDRELTDNERTEVVVCRREATDDTGDRIDPAGLVLTAVVEQTGLPETSASVSPEA